MPHAGGVRAMPMCGKRTVRHEHVRLPSGSPSRRPQRGCNACLGGSGAILVPVASSVRTIVLGLLLVSRHVPNNRRANPTEKKSKLMSLQPTRKRLINAAITNGAQPYRSAKNNLLLRLGEKSYATLQGSSGLTAAGQYYYARSDQAPQVSLMAAHFSSAEPQSTWCELARPACCAA